MVVHFLCGKEGVAVSEGLTLQQGLKVWREGRGSEGGRKGEREEGEREGESGTRDGGRGGG